MGLSYYLSRKKNGALQMEVDYCTLNKQTIKNRYMLPYIDDLFDQLVSDNVVLSLALAQEYHQIHIEKEDAPKICSVPHLGIIRLRS